MSSYLLPGLGDAQPPASTQGRDARQRQLPGGSGGNGNGCNTCNTEESTFHSTDTGRSTSNSIWEFFGVMLSDNILGRKDEIFDLCFCSTMRVMMRPIV